MDIRLTIENVETLPEGASPRFTARDRSFEIGRDGGDWQIPDPQLIVSGRHCQVRFDGSAYWLHDMSRNGTFVNGASDRIDAPYRLRDGDTIRVGRYRIAVAIGTGEVPGHGTGAFFAPAEAAAGGGASLHLQSGRQRLSGGSPRGEVEPFLREVAAGAGISPDAFRQRDPAEVAQEIGAVLRIVVEELAGLLKARAAAKAMARSSQQTMISASGNNPLKFVPGAEEMLEKMFGRSSAGYLDAKQALEEAFADLKTHELATYSAMQAALARLMDDLSPQAIEGRVAPSTFGSRKARAWDAFVSTWEAKEQRYENGMLDVFLAYFSESYLRTTRSR